MGSDAALRLFSDLMITALIICGPILAVTLIVGVAVSILQVVTQIQDMSISFIPKMIAAVLALTIFGPWMLRKLIVYATSLIAGIPTYF